MHRANNFFRKRCIYRVGITDHGDVGAPVRPFLPGWGEMSRDPGDFPFLVARHNLWPKRWAGYDRVVAGLFGFPASIWDTRIAKRFVLTTSLAWLTAPLPARTSAYIKRKF
jgi:hypothetical protein